MCLVRELRYLNFSFQGSREEKQEMVLGLWDLKSPKKNDYPKEVFWDGQIKLQRWIIYCEKKNVDNIIKIP